VIANSDQAGMVGLLCIDELSMPDAVVRAGYGRDTVRYGDIRIASAGNLSCVRRDQSDYLRAY
jgi:hypothetical protein